jgi:Abortive infection alpha
MDPSEIVKAAPQIIEAAAPVAAAIPFTGIVKRMLGPAADELAEMWRDRVRLYRYGRQIKCVEKAEKMAEEAGFTPSAVPPKILFPLLEGASLEDNEELHTMWAALLANASSKKGSVIRPSFITILKNMAADEAGLLKQLNDGTEAVENIRSEFERRKKAIKEEERGQIIYMSADKDPRWVATRLAQEEVEAICAASFERFAALDGESESERQLRHESCIASLLEFGLIVRYRDNDPLCSGRTFVHSKGKTFLAACTPPKR